MITVRAGGGGIMVWGKFLCRTIGSLIFANTTLKSTAYLHIIVNHELSLVFGYNNSLWRWSFSAGPCTLPRCSIGLILRNNNHSLASFLRPTQSPVASRFFKITSKFVNTPSNLIQNKTAIMSERMSQYSSPIIKLSEILSRKI
ncbi:hypothetical protein TNCV_2495051 [Trichonephila clavipes]|nr:hypothetical protein TNCV_2495051 [Trichonephila clavipes]